MAALALLRIAALAAALTAVLSAWATYRGLRGGELYNLPAYGSLKPFTLTDEQGRPFTAERLKGKVAVVNFIFSSCPTACPLLTRTMARVQEKTAAWGPHVQLLSISVDPQTDTPERLRAYGERHGADFSRWHFLTGPLQSVEEVVVNGFMVALGPRTGEKPELTDITHGENFVVLDRAGRIRAFRHGRTAEEADGIARLASYLVRESRGEGPTVAP